MLRYLNQGLRPFGDYPMPVHKRLNWDFYAVVDGRLAPVFESQDTPELVGDTLWLFPPGSAHGWIGVPENPCQVVVFHFNFVPPELERRVRQAGGLAVPLTSADKHRLQRLEAELRQHYWRPNPLSELHFERALMELSLLALEKPEVVRADGSPDVARGRFGMADARRQAVTNPALARVLAAENWFRQHLAAQPSLASVSRACGLSTGHLRRLFHAVRRLGPKEVFDRIRMEHAMQLLAHSDRKLSDVATECGFAGASQLCQVFKCRNGTTPTFWSKHAYTQYQDPSIMAATPREVLVHFGLVPAEQERFDAG
jgi:AraC family transcriptional regulator